MLTPPKGADSLSESICKRRAPSAFAQSCLMIVIVLCFASTLLSLQLLALAVSCAFLTHYRQYLWGVRGGVLWMILIVMLLALPLNIWRNPAVLPYVLIEGVAVALALVLVSNSDAYWRASRVVLLGSQALVLGYLALVGLDDFPLEDIIPGASSNGVTSYLILLQCNYGVARFIKTNRASLITAAVTVGICIVGFGRGSMVASLGLLVLNAVFLFRQWTVLGRWWPVLTVLVLIFLIAPQWDEIVVYFETNTKLGAGFVDPSRSSILEAYLNKLDAWSLVWGADYTGTGVNEDYRGNPHNSFIRAHHLYGLPYVVFVLFPMAWALTRPISAAVRLYAVVVLSLLLFRAFTEPILFPTLLDVFYFAICMSIGRSHRVPNTSYAY